MHVFHQTQRRLVVARKEDFVVAVDAEPLVRGLDPGAIFGEKFETFLRDEPEAKAIKVDRAFVTFQLEKVVEKWLQNTFKGASFLSKSQTI